MLAINAVSIYGVFGAHWPVGTAIALYWCENILRLGIQLALKRRATGLLGIAVVFNAVHAVFLAIILFSLLPRFAPAQRFDLDSFRLGIALVAILLILEVFFWRYSDEQYFRRVVVIHIVIIFGMFGIIMFNKVVVLFGTFAAMKVLVDLLPVARRAQSEVE